MEPYSCKSKSAFYLFIYLFLKVVQRFMVVCVRGLLQLFSACSRRSIGAVLRIKADKCFQREFFVKSTVHYVQMEKDWFVCLRTCWALLATAKSVHKLCVCCCRAD